MFYAAPANRTGVNSTWTPRNTGVNSTWSPRNNCPQFLLFAAKKSEDETEGETGDSGQALRVEVGISDWL
jgi:hypothetical protein